MKKGDSEIENWCSATLKILHPAIRSWSQRARILNPRVGKGDIVNPRAWKSSIVCGKGIEKKIMLQESLPLVLGLESKFNKTKGENKHPPEIKFQALHTNRWKVKIYTAMGYGTSNSN